MDHLGLGVVDRRHHFHLCRARVAAERDDVVPSVEKRGRIGDDLGGNDIDIVFKDEEGTGADRMMTRRLRARLARLARLVSTEWPGLRLRVTEAWDERREHGDRSVHYEGRAADITTSDANPAKLGRLGWLAHEAELEWVLYEDPSHVHVSVQR